MSGAVMVAASAAIGNMIQGWDNACIAGAVLYIKKEFSLQNEPTIEGLIVAMSLIGATLVTTCSGAVSDSLGRRPMLIISSILYFFGGLVMLWSPNVYILLLGRLLNGLGIGLVVTLVPVYISETSPPEIRGSLNTLPQFMGSGGMFLSYCMVFGMSLMESPSWRVMLGVLSIPSLFYFVLTIFFLPESPRWLVSKGRMLEAKHVLQRLRGKDDVAGLNVTCVPRNPELLWAQIPDAHRSYNLFTNLTDEKLKVRRATAGVNDQLRDEPIHGNVMEYVESAGFGGVFGAVVHKLDHHLIKALVERWRPETNTFHFPIGEATVTLQDAQVIWGLPIDGPAVCGDWVTVESSNTSYWSTLCQNMLGFTPAEPDEMKGGKIMIHALCGRLVYPLDINDDVACQQRARVVILAILASSVFVDSSTYDISLNYLQNLTDLSREGRKSWGGAVIANLYRNLTKATAPDRKGIEGPLLLLQYWAWERMTHIAPRLIRDRDDDPYDYSECLANRWLGGLTHTDTPAHVASAYRSFFNALTNEQFNWTPYTDFINNLPDECTDGQQLWSYSGPLVFWNEVEPTKIQKYNPDFPSPDPTYSVKSEMALLVEGLGIGGKTAIEEYIIGPAGDIEEADKINLYGHDDGVSLVARPIVSRQGSALHQSVPLMDPLVTLFNSVHEKLPDGVGSKGSMLFLHFGSMFSVTGNPIKTEDWDTESVGGREGDDYQSDHALENDPDDTLHTPLISRQNTSVEKDTIQPATHESILSLRNAGEQVSSTDIGGGWQLAWKWSQKDGQERENDEGFKRIYLHQEIGADMPADSDSFQAAALVSQPALYSKDLMDQNPVGPAMIHPAEATKSPSWSDLFEPGVKHALFVGIGLQILQQFSGINGVLYYTPQILEEAGVGVLLSNFGLSSTSSSLLISNITTLLMLPCIAVAMRLMDISGRRALLLTTIPVLILSLVVLVIGGLVNFGSIANAAISTASVIIYFCCFVMGFGPIPNILCSEIFPTRVRGICIAICALTFWICDIIVTYSLPVLLTSVGLPGVFAFYAIVCIISWVFVFLKVPETKGMPLEVITEFFSVGAKHVDAAKNN